MEIVFELDNLTLNDSHLSRSKFGYPYNDLVICKIRITLIIYM